MGERHERTDRLKEWRRRADGERCAGARHLQHEHNHGDAVADLPEYGAQREDDRDEYEADEHARQGEANRIRRLNMKQQQDASGGDECL
ncbi:hypothetical protein D3C84_786430 [compost metagenome]